MVNRALTKTALTIRLLVVEDDDAYPYLIRKAFSIPPEKTRWELTVATDGQEALDLLFKEENEQTPLPDLILLDWKPPKVNGDKVLRTVSCTKDYEKCPSWYFLV
jgi:two-component system, chemotaxis family, response regulator Rcp1